MLLQSRSLAPIYLVHEIWRRRRAMCRRVQRTHVWEVDGLEVWSWPGPKSNPKRDHERKSADLFEKLPGATAHTGGVESMLTAYEYAFVRAASRHRSEAASLLGCTDCVHTYIWCMI